MGARLTCIVVAFVALLLSTTGSASAHAPLDGVVSFYGGFLHPLLTPAHALAIIGVGLLAGQLTQRWLRPVPGLFMAGTLLGFASLPYLTPMVAPSVMLLALACGCGAVVALSRALPTAVVGIIAFVVGLSVGVDSALEPAPLNEVMVALLGTLSGATVLLFLFVELSMACQRDWQRLGVRVAGSWISASAMLILATVL